MFRSLIATEADWGATILRTVPGVVSLTRGAQTLLGWFGGHGLAATTGFFTERLHIPAPLAGLAIAPALAAASAVMVRGSGAGSPDHLLSPPRAADASRLAEA